jgi:hypothetical protein
MPCVHVTQGEELLKQLPPGRSLTSVSIDPNIAHVLRPVAFNPAQHAILSEELKHLYTAMTRAKNNVIICDSSPSKSAPFYHLLQRLGMAR